MATYAAGSAHHSTASRKSTASGATRRRARNKTGSVAVLAVRSAAAVGRETAAPQGMAGTPAPAMACTLAANGNARRLSRLIRSACAATRRSAWRGPRHAEPARRSTPKSRKASRIGGAAAAAGAH